MSRKDAIELKARYYLDHFNELIGFVVSHYDHALEDSHRSFLGDFQRLSLDAQCLYIRLVTRKGSTFYREYLKYDEISDLDLTLDELRTARFTRDPDDRDFLELLALQKRPDLVSLIRDIAEDAASVPLRLSSARKKELVEYVFENFSFEECFPFQARYGYLVQGRQDEVEYLLYLYFGKTRLGLTSFALRDLGVVKTAGFRRDFKARFDSREAALASYHYDKMARKLKTAPDAEILILGEESAQWPTSDDPDAMLLQSRTVHTLGRRLERMNEIELALSVYGLTDQFPSTERVARLLVSLDRRKEAESLLSQMIDNPSCDEELIFAEDFFARKFEKQRVGRLTQLLRDARVIGLDETGRDYPEATAAGKLAEEGWEAWHTENTIWQQLFGLTFWDLLFDPENAALHNEFEWRPSGLDSGVFFERNRERIEERLSLFDFPDKAVLFLRDVWNNHRDTPNGILPWYEDVFELLCRFVSLAPSGSLSSILRELASDYRANRSGFPDLLLIKGSEIRFVEVKAEGDQIRRNQLLQLERLRNAGFTVEVIRAIWTVDPEQEYVVVDIETTGGGSQWNRITEIGAVKMKGNRIVDEWSSLVNPERRIPKNIVHLTGITDEMVSNAPTFREIADEFRNFVGNAVFAAHRAAFDYGFIRAEYQRLEQDFRCPTLCTVVAARRHLPGMSSYGLANLCRELEITLESHHRALCDARATAEILQKINHRRMEKEKSFSGEKL